MLKLNLRSFAALRVIKVFQLFGMLLCLTSCSVYHAKPLPTQPNLLQNLPAITVKADKFKNLPVRYHNFDAAQPLDMDDVAILAVINNPDLRLARDDAKIAHAQAFAAGLLPDPQISLGKSYPTNSPPDTTIGFNAGVNYDLNTIIGTYAAKVRAKAQERQVNLNLLWQEWQVISQAKLLFIKNVAQNKLLQLLQANQALLAKRYQQDQKALKRGDVTLDAISSDLLAAQDAEKQLNDLMLSMQQNQYDLHQLLGLAPTVKFILNNQLVAPMLAEKNIQTDLQQLPQRRADLLALQAGYQSEDLRLRQAILGQFPAINFGFSRARDTSDIYTNNFAITFDLPIFNRNRGNIAIERATRQRLYDEYQARLNTAYSDIQLIVEQQLLRLQQLHTLKPAILQLQRVVNSADKAMQKGDIDNLTYINLRTTLLNKQVEQINLEETILEQNIALQTLLGIS